MFDLLATVLAWFYSLWPSYGMAVVFLTSLVMIAVTPFTMKGSRSMLKMQLLAPELKKIQTQYRGDRQAMNKASMAFYQEHGVNPVGGCLPLLLQGPIFFVLYQLLNGLNRRTTEIGTQLGFTSSQFSATYTGGIREYSTTSIPRSDLPFDPDFLSPDTDLYRDLSTETEMVSWGMDLSRTASRALSEGVVTALPYFIMILLVLVTGIYQHRQIQGRQTNVAINPTQQTIMKLIPYFLPVISYTLPAAVVVYFIVSALFRIAQQAYITRSLYSGDESPGAQLARQRKSSQEKGSPGGQSGKPAKKTSAKSVTSSKGRPTPKRDSRAPQRSGAKASSQARKPVTPRRKRSSRPTRSVSGAGRSGKAPSRHKKQGGRITPRQSTTKHNVPNRSKRKKKRR